MMSPQDKYENDAMYKRCVDMMEMFVAEGKFTPSEMRYQARVQYCTLPTEVMDALKTLADRRKKEDKR